jgi:hypothetical protein
MERELKVGQHVIFIDSLRKPHDAVVTAAWSPTCCNLVIVSDDAEKTDTYGRQIERHTSVCKASAQGDVTYGMVFCHPGELEGLKFYGST